MKRIMPTVTTMLLSATLAPASQGAPPPVSEGDTSSVDSPAPESPQSVNERLKALQYQGSLPERNIDATAYYFFIITNFIFVRIEERKNDLCSRF